MSTMNRPRNRAQVVLDLSIFTVITREADGSRQVAEREWSDATSKLETAHDIGLNPNGWTRVDCVIESNPAEGWSRDVSNDICGMILASHTQDELSNCAISFVDDHCGAGFHFNYYREIAA